MIAFLDTRDMDAVQDYASDTQYKQQQETIKRMEQVRIDTGGAETYIFCV